MSISRLMQMGAAYYAANADPWTDPDLANASYDNVSFSVAAKANFPAGLAFSADGATMFITGTGQVLTYPSVIEYSLSTAWDITSASYDSRF